jgi:hypothetical protein
MRRTYLEFARPHRALDFELVRRGREGVYWHDRDGMVVRVAASEGGELRRREPEWRHTLAAALTLGRSGAT